MIARKTALTIIGTLLCAAEVLGANYLADEVQLNNGTKLKGMISVQYIKKQNYTVTSYESEIILKKNQIVDQQKYKVTIKDLPEKWGAWVKEHPEYALGDESITLSTIVVNTKDIVGMTLPDHLDSVLVIPSATDTKIIDFSKHDIGINLSSIAMVKKIYTNDVSPKIKEKVETRDNKTYSGRTLSQIPGKTIIFSSEEEGVVSLNFKDIKSSGFETTVSTDLINDVCEYEEIVEDVYGNRYEGVIIKKNYGEKDTPSFILIKRHDSPVPEFVQNKDIQVIYKRIKGSGGNEKSTRDDTTASNADTPSTNADTPYAKENTSYEEVVQASNSVSNDVEPASFIEVNGFRCPTAKVQIKGSKYRLPMQDNVMTFQSSDIKGTIKISRAGGNLIKSEGGQTNELVIKMSEVPEKSISASNTYTFGQEDYKPEYKLEPGIYVYIVDGEECIFIEIQ